MKKSTKKSLRIALLLCIVGLVICLVSFIAVGCDIKKMSTVTYETNTYEISETFTDIVIDVYTADIHFLPASDGRCKIVCWEEEKVKHSAKVQNGTLVLDTVDTRKWYDYIGMSFEDAELTIYLPEAQYKSLDIKSDIGDVEMPKNFYQIDGCDL